MPINKVKNEKKDGLQKYKVRVNYKDAKGNYKQVCKTAYGMEDAKRQEYLIKLKVTEKDEASVNRMSVQALYEEYIFNKQYEVRLSTLSKTKQVMRNYILRELSDYNLSKLGAKELQKWKLSMEERDLATTTKNNAYTELRTMLNFAVKMEYISKNPLSLVGNFKAPLEMKKEMDFYTPDEFKKFISAGYQYALNTQKEKSSYFEWDYYVFFNIAFYTGLRKGEIHGLRWSCVEGNCLNVKYSICQKVTKEDIETPPKNRSSIRKIQIPKPLIDILKEHKKRKMTLPNFSEEDRVLGVDKSLRDTSIRNRSREFAKIAGVKYIRIHDFRHSHASLLANMGINIQEVSRRLGHANIEMTWNTYSHLYPQEEEKAIAVLNEI